MNDVASLTKELVSRPSVTPNDAGCQQLIASRLANIGFEIEHMPFGSVDNLWARYGTSGKLLVFAGHTDVVTPGSLELWDSDPFVPVIKDGVLYGRGAADMKSGLAAMVVATEQFLQKKQHIKGSIAFLITSDEEGPSIDGTLKVMELLEKRSVNIDWCILGEPSSLHNFGDTLRNGRRGSLTGLLKIHGIQGHIAYPEHADNPIQRVLPALTELYEQNWDIGNEYFAPTSFQISNFNSGTGAGNVIPASADIRFNFRYSNMVTAEILQKRVHKILDRHKLSYQIEWRAMGSPFLTPPGLLTTTAQKVIESITGIIPSLDTGGGTSDGRFIAPKGGQVIEFGPLNTSIHKVNECVSLAELELLVRVYKGIMQALLG